MTIQTRLIEYEHEGQRLEGFLAWDDTRAAPLPGVLVSHAWAGRSEFECNKAIALAELGYAGFALDLYGKGVLGTNADENGALMMPLKSNRPRLLARLQSALAAARSQAEVDSAKVAAIGFCFGGLCVLDLARGGADLAGVVSFHGLLDAPEGSASTGIDAKILVLHGWDDPMAPPEHVLGIASELTAAGADWQIHGYGNTLHAFTNPEANDPGFGTVYSAAADARSWDSMKQFLAEVL